MVKKRAGQVFSRENVDAVIFDLDGVVTQTAKVHAAAWKALFDPYLKERQARDGRNYEPFDPGEDYRQYVDGKPRYDGVRSFLEARDISIPEGKPEDPPGKETICGIGNKKNEIFLEELERQGVETYDSTVMLIHSLRAQGIKTAIISASKNCGPVLETAGLSHLFDAKVDGVDSAELGLQGKPAPDIFLEAARRLKVDPARAVVVEDALAGVEGARRGRFAQVIGVDRAEQEEALRKRGADIVVKDLAEIRIENGGTASMPKSQELPSALDHINEIIQHAEGKRLAVFLDYDGTLTPIADRPEQAKLSENTRAALRVLARKATVAIISGRDLQDVRSLVGIEDIFYAGSHGFDIAGPAGDAQVFQEGESFIPILDRAEQEIRQRADPITGSFVERKRFSIALHYRKVPEKSLPDVQAAVDETLERFPKLRKSSGKKIYELQPDIDWHKGKALYWLLDKLDLDRPDVLPLYIGDDLTDEDAFRSLENRGLGIIVRDEPHPTHAAYALENSEHVKEFLEALTRLLEKGAV
ncbi:MAG TPA: trehalose-phosphatase [Candidatus Binatia bacterium]|nr:trehalose-phosphatase [Candidatus Binatia bacterium]